MTENYKDNLQKLIQKYRLPNPEYVTIKSGPDHNPDFISTVTVNDEIFRGVMSKTKKFSEVSAAFIALENLDNFSENKKCMLINLDNLQSIYNEITIKELSNPNLDIYLFMGKNNYLIDKIMTNEIIKVISPSIEINSTNIYMTMYIGSLLTKNLYDTYFVATDTEFSSILMEIIKYGSLNFDNKKAYQITNINQIYKNL